MVNIRDSRGRFIVGHEINRNRKWNKKALESYKESGINRKKIKLPKSFFVEEYTKNKKNSSTIAKELDVCKATVLKELKRFHIKMRTPNLYKSGNIPHTKGKRLSNETRLKIKQTLDYLKEKGLYKFPVKDTSIEIKIQNYLKQLNIEFFTHQYMHIEHGYQCDILIPSMNLVIECDGTYWHKYPVGRDIDHIRTKELLEKGFKVLRLWEFEINAMTIEDLKEKLT